MGPYMEGGGRGRGFFVFKGVQGGPVGRSPRGVRGGSPTADPKRARLPTTTANSGSHPANRPGENRTRPGLRRNATGRTAGFY
ncbi:hypothetical protein Arub01_17690 [Actinomadura rubrobrunea]|uniref:Uncharacterized protein n=1 Tax=Actinomadura rubrobrunea TaxID=115335 RepID=A0A9W6PTQ1_9ACTN|nr:hypothetical protein Arub01_17690 [Actinomadura rubrobrunea]